MIHRQAKCSVICATAFGLALFGAGPKSPALAGVLGSAGTVQTASLESAPVQMTLDYEVYFGPLHILSTTAQLIRSESSYRLIADAETRGVVDVLFDWSGRTETVGVFRDGRVVPQKHLAHGKSPKRERQVEMLYTPTGMVEAVTIDPEPDLSEVNPLPEDADVGTIDPLSAIAELSVLFSRDPVCEAEYAIFDGRRRYDLMLSHAGTIAFEPSEDSVFTGTAMECDVKLEVLGGDRKEKSEYVETTSDRRVFVARPFADGPSVPVRLEIETGLGTLVAHLTGVSDGHRVLALKSDEDEEDVLDAKEAAKPAWAGANAHN